MQYGTLIRNQIASIENRHWVIFKVISATENFVNAITQKINITD